MGERATEFLDRVPHGFGQNGAGGRQVRKFAGNGIRNGLTLFGRAMDECGPHTSWKSGPAATSGCLMYPRSNGHPCGILEETGEAHEFVVADHGSLEGEYHHETHYHEGHDRHGNTFEGKIKVGCCLGCHTCQAHWQSPAPALRTLALDSSAAQMLRWYAR